MTEETSSEHFIPFDLIPPAVFSKGWHRIAEEIRVNPEKGETYLGLLLEWLDSQCGTGWRAKVVVIDLVLPNPTENLNTISGFLIGRRIGDATAMDVLRRHEESVLKLKDKRMSIGLNGVFIRGLPQIDADPPQKSVAALKKALEGKTLENITKRNMLYASLPSLPAKPGLTIAEVPPNSDFHAKVIGYTPQREEMHNPLGGKDDQNIEDNWRTYQTIVEDTLPEIKSVAAMSIVTPGDEDNLTLTFNPAGQVFLCFNVDALSSDGNRSWEPDCLSIVRALVIFTLVSNASLVRQAALNVERNQVESHELGEAFSSLQTRLFQFTSLDPLSENLVQTGNAIFFAPLWQAALDQMYLWTMKNDSVLSQYRFNGCTSLKSWIEACWHQTIDFCAIKEFNNDLASLRRGGSVSEVEKKISNWRFACQAALQVEGSEDLINSAVQKSGELAGLVRGLCAVMRDVLKHEGKTIIEGGKTVWSIRFEKNHPPDHLSPRNHPALIIEQSNAVAKSVPASSTVSNSGKTTLVVRRYLPVFARFDRDNSYGQHVDRWCFIDGELFNALEPKEGDM
jgi:hypothetical protein